MFKKIIRATALVIVCTAIIAMNSSKATDTYAIDQSDVENAQNQIQETKNKIEELNSELSQLGSDISSVEAYVEELDNTLADIANNISYYNTLISSKQAEIDAKNQEITDKQAEIDATEVELSEAAATEDKQYADMKKRIQYMYEQGEESFLELIFTSGDLSELLGRAEYVSSITEYDRNQLDALRATKAHIEELLTQMETEKEDLETEKSTLETQKADLLTLQQGLQSQQEVANQALDAKEATLSKLETDQAYAEAAKKAEEAKLASQEAEAKKLQEEWAAAVAAASANGEDANEANARKLEEIGLAGGFTWPLPGFNKITSYFGPRIHPVLGTYSNHSGVDISGAGVFGQPVHACYAGTVTSVDIYRGDMYAQPYGTSIKIDHGAGVVTLYAHLSGVNVSVGQVVSAGDIIGYVGSTGQSTGAHLHLTLYIKGVLSDPLQFLTIPSY